MKKFILLSLILTLFLFTLPVLAGVRPLENAPAFTGQDPDDPPVSAEPSAEPDAADLSGDGSSDDESLTLRILADGAEQTMTMSDYLNGVVLAEMPADSPAEALKAQAVVARTYAFYKKERRAGGQGDEAHPDADLCDDSTHCRAYLTPEAAAARLEDQAAAMKQQVREAVSDTDGIVMLYEDKPILAVCFAISSGKTESAADMWGRDLPYLSAVDSAEDKNATHYQGHVELSADDFKKAFLAAWPDDTLDDAPDRWFGALTRSESGGVVSMQVGTRTLSGLTMRALCGLASPNFTLVVKDSTLVFDTLGYGHGVGLSQYGALMMARQGQSYRDILRHYYAGVSVEKSTPQALEN